MGIQPSILIYGSAPQLIDTRRQVLEHSGFEVTVTLSLEHARTLLTSQTFDLFILCHSLSLQDCEGALSEVDSLCPEMNRLILSTVLSSCKGFEGDAHLTAFAAPQTLIAMVRQLTRHLHPNLQKGQDSYV